MMIRNRSSSFPKIILPIALSAAAIAMLSATGPTAFWRHSEVGVGHLNVYKGPPNESRERMRSREPKCITKSENASHDRRCAGSAPHYAREVRHRRLGTFQPISSRYLKSFHQRLLSFGCQVFAAGGNVSPMGASLRDRRAYRAD